MKAAAWAGAGPRQHLPGEGLKGKKIGISKSLNTIKNDWWRIQEHMGIENMLRLENKMSMV